MRSRISTCLSGRRFRLSISAALVVMCVVGAAMAPVASASISQVGSWGGIVGGSFNGPHGMAVDASGNVYVTDYYNHRIQKFDSSGAFLQQWGSTDVNGNPQCTSDSGGFCNPTGIAVDASGNIYVADANNNRIAKLTISSGTWSYFTTFNGSDSFSQPYDISIEAATNRLFITDRSNHRIVVLGSSGTFVRAWGGYGSSAAPAQYSSPSGIKVTATQVFVADQYNNRVVRTSLTGTSGTAVGTYGSGNGEFSYPYDVEVDSSNRLYVADTSNARIQRFTSALAYSTQWGTYGAGDGEFSNPYGLALTGTTMYVADYSNGRVQKFTTVSATPTFSLKFGSQTGTAPGELSGPQDVATGNGGSVFVTDTNDHQVDRFSASGTPLNVWGTYGFNPGEFYYPEAVGTDSLGQVYVSASYLYVDRFTETGGSPTRILDSGLGAPIYNPGGIDTDAAGNIYVVDRGNYQVDKYDPAGTLLQTFGSYGFGDGRFSAPQRVAVDADGYVYVTDSSLYRVTKFNAAGQFVTKWGDSGSGDGEFNAPRDIDVDADGNVYVTDTGRVQKFRPDGRFLLSFGSGELYSAYGVAVAGGGDIYVADQGASRVRRYSESDTSPPNTTITSTPTDPTSSTSASFSLSSTESGTYECALDSTTAYAVCSDPKLYTALSEGSHTFRVRAVDTQGNVDPTPAAYTWVVDTAAPNTSITAGPSGTTYDRTPTYSFESSEPGSTFQCRVDSDPFASCTSPRTTSALTDGAHTFEVRAIDAAGTTDPSPASRAFTLSTTAVSVSGSTLTTTGTGADDNIQINKPDSATISVVNTAVTGYSAANVAAGSGCTQISDTRADCPSAGITLLDVSGETGADRLANNAGIASKLNGGADDDRVIGGSSADALIGGTGPDELLGKGGTDVADYTGRVDALTVKVDGIATDGSTSDADGTDSRRDNIALDVENVTGGSGNDSLTGTAGVNVLVGGPGDDSLFGEAGNDTLDGGLGADVINGGSHTDTVTYEARVGGVTVTGDGAVANDGDASDVSGVNRDNVKNDVERILGGPGNDTITGGPGTSGLIGGDGDDVLSGGSGNDTVDGGAGADDLNGGPHTDTVTYASRTGSVSVNSGDAVASDGNLSDDNGARRDNVASDVEDLIGGSDNDLLIGNPNLNRIEGGSGDDVLQGLGNPDTLVGGPGADDLDGGAAVDTASYEASSSGVTVTLAGLADDGNASDDNGVRRDDLISVANVIGSPYADSLTGSSGANTLTGGLGADTLIGLDGNDVLQAKDGVADTTIDCDGGGAPGTADSVQRDTTDPAASGCEVVVP